MSITDVTRNAIIDEMMLSGVHWAGCMEEPAFLGRLYPIQDLPSYDTRFQTAAEDVWQHRVNNPQDWPDDWVFTDARFGLASGNDEEFLNFLAATVHPRARPDPEESQRLVESYNSHLRPDGYELVVVAEISGRPVYAAHSVLSVPSSLRQVENASIGDRDYLARQITRMETSIETDPELAIGTAKELIETSCKTILQSRKVTPDRNWDVPRLMKETAKELQLTPEGVSDDVRGADTIRRILGSLASVVAGTAELRNHYGSGHGRGPGAVGLEPRHARLVVGAASTLAMFLFETFDHRSEASSGEI